MMDISYMVIEDSIAAETLAGIVSSEIIYDVGNVEVAAARVFQRKGEDYPVALGKVDHSSVTKNNSEGDLDDFIINVSVRLRTGNEGHRKAARMDKAMKDEQKYMEKEKLKARIESKKQELVELEDELEKNY